MDQLPKLPEAESEAVPRPGALTSGQEPPLSSVLSRFPQPWLFVPPPRGGQCGRPGLVESGEVFPLRSLASDWRLDSRL